MSKNDRFRSTGVRPLFLSSLFGLVVASFAGTQGCTGGEVDPPEEEGGDGNNANGDRDAGGDPVVEDELTAVIAAIDDGNLDTVFTLDGTGSLNPSGRVVEYAWEVDAPDGDGCEGIIAAPAGPTTTFTPSCRGVHRVTLTVSLVDGSVSSKAEESFSVDNRVPVLSALAADGAFLPGEDVVISATVTDEDTVDQPACTARLASDNQGDPTGLVIPSEPSTSCSFTITTPPRVDTWKIEVVANDGFDDSLPVTIELTPGNEPPVITEVLPEADAVTYSCFGIASCTSETFDVTIQAQDDSDDFESLVIELVNVTDEEPEGATVSITPDFAHGVFHVVVSRDGLGPLAGTYTLQARVTEYTAGADGPATVTQDIEVDVTNAPPLIAQVVAPDVDHAYVTEEDVYTAVVTMSAIGSDPEGNDVVSTVELVSCPQGPVGDSQCGGSAVEIVESPTVGGLSLALEAGNLINLVGAYTFRVTVVDADGATTSDERFARVTNEAPARAAGFMESIEQSYIGTGHTALTPLFFDPDGDPITILSRAIECPDGSTITTSTGVCATEQSVTIDDQTGLLRVTGPAEGLLGPYAIELRVTDGAAPIDLSEVVTVTNSPPTVSRTSTGTVTCHHTTEDGTVTNESGCDFPYTGNVSDPNGDPLTYSVTLSPSNGYSLTGETIDEEPVSGAQISFSSAMQTTHGNFASTFDAQSQRIVVVVEDSFGASAASGMNPRLNNRPPAVSTKAFTDQSFNYGPERLDNIEIETVVDHRGVERGWAGSAKSCAGCASPPPYRFGVIAYPVDPDNDPLTLELDIECPSSVSLYPSGDETAPKDVGEGNGFYDLQIAGTLKDCSTALFPPRQRQWSVGLTGCGFAGGCNGYSFGCTIFGGSSVVSDGVDVDDWGGNLYVDFGLDLETDTPLTCN